MPKTITPPDWEFAAATGDNVNATDHWSYFDYPPNSTSDLTITSNEGDIDPFRFETGETYDITWSGHGDGVIEDAVVIRSDYIGPGQGAIVFEGVNSLNGELAQMVWAPNFDLENWYWSNGGGPDNPKAFWTSDQDAQSYQTICFAAGTMIATPRGRIAVEALRPGHRVSTRDGERAEILWMGAQTVLGRGACAPVRVAPGVIGNDRELVVSPQHRLMLASPLAELWHGASEVLVPARALVEGGAAVQTDMRQVTYHHILLAGHAVLDANGAPAESLYLGDVALGRLDAGETSEVAAFFPELAGRQPMKRPASARPVLAMQDAAALVRAMGLARDHAPCPSARRGAAI